MSTGSYLVNGEPMGMSLGEFFARHLDEFSFAERERIRALKPGEAAYGGPKERAWKIERIT